MSDLEPGPAESLDRLAGEWRIFQLRRGHRFSTDDLVTAWRAALALPRATRLLDLGCGIGSVGLCTLWRLRESAPEATLTGIEAQEESVGLARRTIRFNHLDGRAAVHHGDLRDATILPPGSAFDLVTGSPPYIPPGTGLLSPVPQRAAARIELRGSIFDYCAAARRWLAPGGRFAYVMAAADPRTEQAPPANDLVVVERFDVVFREPRPPLITVIVCARAEDGPHPPRSEGRLAIRDGEGRFTPDYLRFRAEMGVDALG